MTIQAVDAAVGARSTDRGKVAVCVSGRGTNLRALHRDAVTGRLAGEIVLVVADRECEALDFARYNGIRAAVVAPRDHPDPRAWDRALSAVLGDAQPDAVVLAGFMRRIGPEVLGAFGGRILNVHPSLLPAFPGARAVEDALAAGAKVTGVTVHLVDEDLDAGPIVLQESVQIAPTDEAASLLDRLHAVEHRLLPRAVSLLLAGALRVDGRVVAIDPAVADVLPRRRRALLSVSDKRGITAFATKLAALGYELVSTGGTARALRDAGLDVTDVSTVTGFPEMLDGRVKTLHPRIAAGVLGDLRLRDHRVQLAGAAIEPFDLVAVNLYPFAAAASRPDITVDELVGEIDIGGPTLLRAAAKNHASVAVVTSPDDYEPVVAELERDGRVGESSRRRLAAAAFGHTAAYDTLIASVLPDRLGVDSPTDGVTAAEGARDPFPDRASLQIELVERLRYGENPHQRAALYRLSGTPDAAGPFARGVTLLQGKALSYNNLLDAAAAAALARDLQGVGCAIVKHANPCGAAEAADVVEAWRRALAADPVSAFGGVVALNRPLHVDAAAELTSLFLEVVVAPAVDDPALALLARKPNLRVVVDPSLGRPAERSIEYRSAGGGLLATESDVLPDDPAAWQTVTRRRPTAAEWRDLEFAWRVVRHVRSNAIVLARDRAVVGVGAGQMSRVDSARLAVAKSGEERARGAVCASDAFYPFPDGLEACAEAGVTAFVQPGGSQRDADVIAAADRFGAAMVFTGNRHFRH